MVIPSAPTIALAISYVGIVFACLWRGRLRWIGLPMAFAVALWPRPAPPVAWIASDGNNAAIVYRGQEVVLKTAKSTYATDLWAQRRGLHQPADAAKAQAAAFDCNRLHCKPLPHVQPALATWWTRRKPNNEALADLCDGAQIVVMRADVSLPPACGKALVFTRRDFAIGGAAEVFSEPAGWRVAWSQPIRGDRPWTQIRE